MARPSDKKLADLAVSILSQLSSATVDVFSADGGVLSLEMQHQHGQYIVANAPRLRVRPQLELLARTTDPEGGGHDIEMSVAEIFYESRWVAKVHLRVRDVKRRDSHRVAARAQIEELALLHVLGARTIAEDEEFDVRLADLSPSGVAFVTEHQFTIGDRCALMASVGGRVIRMQARVLQTSGSHYGRQRVGCEILQITDNDRRRIAELTTEVPHHGSPEERRRRVA